MKKLAMASFDILGYHLMEPKASLAAELPVSVRTPFLPRRWHIKVTSFPGGLSAQVQTSSLVFGQLAARGNVAGA
jgi:hypothetical protein